MANCVVSGKVVDPSGTALSGIPVLFNTQNPSLTQNSVQGSTSTASDGTWSLSLLQGVSGIFVISPPNSSSGKQVPYRFNVNVPLSSSASFSSILVDS